MDRDCEMSRSAEGFTQFELIVVLLGAMILMTMGVPVFNSVADQYRVTMAAQTIQTQLQYARMKAVASNESMRVNFFPVIGRSFQVETTTSAVVAGPFGLPRGVNWNAVDPGMPVQFPGGYVEFSPTGDLPAAGNGSAGRVRVMNGSGVRIDIVVTRGGQVRQTAPYKSPPAPF